MKSTHSSALVTLQSWCYNSPKNRFNGNIIDIGALAESLIYYDSVFLDVGNEDHFAALLSTFIQQGAFDTFIGLIEEGIIRIYEYSFISAPIEHNGEYSLVNLQDNRQKEPNTFGRRYLHYPSVTELLKFSRQRIRLHRALENRVIEAKASDFGAAIKNAEKDYKDPDTCAILLQAFVDEVLPLLGWKKAPQVKARVEMHGTKSRITWNLDFKRISEALGEDLNFHIATPLAGIAVCNRLLRSASMLNCDLYLANPMSTLVGNKLFESDQYLIKPAGIVSSLREEVEFPNIRELANRGELNFSHILRIRKKAKRFRSWLQQEGERDRNAIIAYHYEVSREAGLLKFGRSSLKLFGALSGPAIATQLPDEIGTLLGAATAFTVNLAADIGKGWRPVIFGEWLDHYVKKTTRKRE